MYLHGRCWKNYSDHFIKAATRNLYFVDSGVPCGQKRDKIKVVLVQQCTTGQLDRKYVKDPLTEDHGPNPNPNPALI